MVLSRPGPVTRSQTGGKRKRVDTDEDDDEVDGSEDEWSPEDDDEDEDEDAVDGRDDTGSPKHADPGLAGVGEEGARAIEESPAGVGSAGVGSSNYKTPHYECFVCDEVKSISNMRCVPSSYHGIALRNFANEFSSPVIRGHLERRPDYVVQPGDRVCIKCVHAWTQRNNTPRVYKCRRVKCILCDTEKTFTFTLLVHSNYIGSTIKNLPLNMSHDATNDAARARLRSIKDYVVQRGDRVCTLCVEKNASAVVYASRDCSFAASRSHATENVATDARRTLLVATALNKDAKRELTTILKLETAGWDFPAQDVMDAPVGPWWSTVRTGDRGSRLQRLETHAAKHPDVAAALDVLKSHTPTIGVEENARRTLLVATALSKDATRGLTNRLKLETAGWHFPAEDVVTAPVGPWWYDLRTYDHGSRLQRLETHAAKHPDVAAALDVLKSYTPTIGVEEDARRTLLVATALSKDATRGLTNRLKLETAGWHFPAEDVVTAPVGPWWYDLRTYDHGSRLQRLETHAAKHPDVAAALDVLKSYTPTIGVEEDARRTLLVATALSKDATRRLTTILKLETAGWHFPAEDVVTAPVGPWWYDVRTQDRGSRLQRLETHAAKHPDVAAALDVLKSHTPATGVEEDARRTLLVATALSKDATRRLTTILKLETAGWHFPAEDVVTAPVGPWWYDVRTQDHGSRLQRLETHAAKHPNVAAALDVLKSYTPTIGVEENARRTLLVATALSKDATRGLTNRLKLETAGWHFPAEDVVTAPVGPWWYDLRTYDHGSRLQRLETHAAKHPDVAAALDVLKSYTPTIGVEEDARRTLLVATALSKDATRRLTTILKLETAGWHFPAEDVVTAPVGPWWYDVRTQDRGSRLQRLETHAAKHPDVAAALDVLKSHTPATGVEEDARRTLLVATALSKDATRRLTTILKLETAGWHFPAEDVVTAPVGPWWYDVRTQDHGSRLQRLETHAAKHPNVAAALDVLKSYTPTIGVEENARRTLLVATALSKDATRGLTNRLKLETAGWHFPAEDVVTAPVGPWWYDLRTYDHGSRLQRLETHAAKHPDVAAALDVLKSYTPTIGVEEDARRTLLVATALSKDATRRLTTILKLETAGWHFPAEDVVTAPVGPWWYDVRTQDRGSRLQRLETHAAKHPDVAAALDVLKSHTPATGVEEDARRTLLVATALSKDATRRLTTILKLETAGWHFPAEDVVTAPVGPWWYDVRTQDHGSRLQRLETHAAKHPNVAAALDVLKSRT